ncbi:MAG: AAA family ATPase [Planctomycetes bacterium]|nr:AAA family ATPase [Planctomycetota bacterium]
MAAGVYPVRVIHLTIKNFRGIRQGTVLLPKHVVFVGDNNTGKSTVLEAIDLVLGPERLSRRPAIDEHDFFGGAYLDKDKAPIRIEVELVVSDLDETQKRRFRDHLEFWDVESNALVGGPPEATSNKNVTPVLRVRFDGHYDKDEDDFAANTYFSSPVDDRDQRTQFGPKDKRECGFLFLRTLRTGYRALSLERGSLLDMILKLEGKTLNMWEAVLTELRTLPVAASDALGINEILRSVQKELSRFVPSEWAETPHLRVSDLTRETLRRIVTVFMGTGATIDGKPFAAPFQHQGTGTINALVLALLSIIAQLKKNVIFAMEEPEIALPPHTQKRIINGVCNNSAQALFTSHSPYVLEELEPSQIVVLQRQKGVLTGRPADYPPSIKPKLYRDELRKRFCEVLMARRVLILEGHAEYMAFPAAARRLHELHSKDFKTLEGLGIAPINAQTDTQVAPLGTYYRQLGKEVYAVADKQPPAQSAQIGTCVDTFFESPEKGLEALIVRTTNPAALKRFALEMVADGRWPASLDEHKPTPETIDTKVQDALMHFFKARKGEGAVAELMWSCTKAEMPPFVVDVLSKIQTRIDQIEKPKEEDESPDGKAEDGANEQPPPSISEVKSTPTAVRQAYLKEPAQPQSASPPPLVKKVIVKKTTPPTR